MGDRGQIVFTDGTERLYIYRHWDGSPEYTIPQLEKFLEWNKERNGDFTYAVANFIYWIKDNTGQEKAGFGISSMAFDDVAHTYVVDLKNENFITIDAYEDANEKGHKIEQRVIES